MAPSDDSLEFNPLGRDLPEPLVATFRDQSQLDFDLAFFEHLLEREPDYVDVLRCQGELLTRKGLHDRAREIDRRLVELLPLDSVAHYNLACSLALLGDPASAIAALRRALECGYDDIDYLLGDSDLDSLRSDPAYQALLRQFSPR
jgi:tetratricopeptide (TPR) repeat protein